MQLLEKTPPVIPKSGKREVFQQFEQMAVHALGVLVKNCVLRISAAGACHSVDLS